MSHGSNVYDRAGPAPASGETCGTCSLLYILGFGLYACPFAVAERARLNPALITVKFATSSSGGDMLHARILQVGALYKVETCKRMGITPRSYTGPSATEYSRQTPWRPSADGAVGAKPTLLNRPASGPSVPWRPTG